MKAVILAGGKGTRLAPYTTVFPKPLVPVGDKPILELILRQLAHFGFTQATLSVGHLAELIQAYFSRGNVPGSLGLEYVFEMVPTGTAGSLRGIPGLDDTFLVMNGDILTTLDYGALIRSHKASGAALTIAMHRKLVPIDLGVLDLDASGLVTGYREKPVLEFPVSMGIYVYEPRVLTHIEEGVYLDFPTLVVRLIAQGETVVGYANDAYWLDIGRHDDYALALEAFDSRRSEFHVD